MNSSDVIRPHLNDAVDGEHSLVRESFLVRQFVDWGRPPPGHAELLQCAHGVPLYSIVVRRENLGSQVWDCWLSYWRLPRVLGSFQFIQDSLEVMLAS